VTTAQISQKVDISGDVAMTTNVLNNYPQMPPLTEEEITVFLHQPLIAKLGTLNEDGTIHIVPVVFKYEKAEFLIGAQSANRRIKNIERNPKVTLLVDDPTFPFKAVLVYGVALLDYDDVLQKRIAILEKYNPREKAVQMAEGLCARWESVIIRIKPDRMVSFDYAKAAMP
jgi:nitroimidazol reductase NimA-like FMN-containing flavoprotein (pyridoxamine 5'-phosphate oxidase superfamily)